MWRKLHRTLEQKQQQHHYRHQMAEPIGKKESKIKQKSQIEEEKLKSALRVNYGKHYLCAHESIKYIMALAKQSEIRWDEQNTYTISHSFACLLLFSSHFLLLYYVSVCIFRWNCKQKQNWTQSRPIARHWKRREKNHSHCAIAIVIVAIASMPLERDDGGNSI